MGIYNAYVAPAGTKLEPSVRGHYRMHEEVGLFNYINC